MSSFEAPKHPLSNERSKLEHLSVAIRHQGCPAVLLDTEPAALVSDVVTNLYSHRSVVLSLPQEWGKIDKYLSTLLREIGLKAIARFAQAPMASRTELQTVSVGRRKRIVAARA